MADFDGALAVKTVRDNEVKVTLVDFSSGSTATNGLNIDGDGAALVRGIDLDIRDLTHASDSIKIGDGTDFLAINADGSINTKTEIIRGLEGHVLSYATSAAVAKDAVITHDYVVTNAKTFLGSALLVGARGEVKVRFGTWDGTTFTVMGVFFQQPKMNQSILIPNLKAVGDGTLAVRIEVTNLDNASDLYSTLQGEEE